MFFNGLVTEVYFIHSVKWIWGRFRPEAVLSGGHQFTKWFELGPQFIGDGIFRGSFPSGHTSVAFSLMALAYVLVGTGATRAQRCLGWMLGALVLANSVAVSVGRAMYGAHWLSDCVASVAFGWVTLHLLFFWGLRVPERCRLADSAGNSEPSPAWWEMLLAFNAFCVALGFWGCGIGLRALEFERCIWLAFLIPLWLALMAFGRCACGGLVCLRLLLNNPQFTGKMFRMSNRPDIHRSGSLWRILVVDSARDLVKVKSLFGLLVFLLLFDRALKFALSGSSVSPGSLTALLKALCAKLPDWVFIRSVDLIAGRLADPRSLLAAMLLFGLKELLSLWPTSAMRCLHREQGRGFGVGVFAFRAEMAPGALVFYRRGSDSTDCGRMAAAGVVTVVTALERHRWNGWAWFFAAAAALVLPLGMSAFSFSSKLAVLATGAPSEKMRWFLRLFYTAPAAVSAWLFYIVRAAVETAALAALPALLHLSIGSVWLRLLVERWWLRRSTAMSRWFRSSFSLNCTGIARWSLRSTVHTSPGRERVQGTPLRDLAETLCPGFSTPHE